MLLIDIYIIMQYIGTVHGLPYMYAHALKLSGLGVHTVSGKSLEHMIQLFQVKTGYLRIIINTLG